MTPELTTEAMDAAPAGALIIWEPRPGDLRPLALKATESADPLARWVDEDGDRTDAAAFMEAWSAAQERMWLYVPPLFDRPDTSREG